MSFYILTTLFGQSGPIMFETDANPNGHPQRPLHSNTFFHEGSYTFSLRQTNVNSPSGDAQIELVYCPILKEKANAQGAVHI